MGRRAKDITGFVKDLVAIEDSETKKRIFKKVSNIAYKNGIFLSSINDFYFVRGKGEFGGFTVPAINLRALTYDLSRAIFRVAKRNNSGAFIFELAKSEMGYTNQPPYEYSAVVLAAAIKEQYRGPVFIQGDHFQVNAKNFKESPEKELDGLRALIEEAISSGFYNIDIDSSTLVDLTQTTVQKQQYQNFDVCAKLTQFIRRIEPKGITVSVGGEIGEVGHKNSTSEELRAFMAGYRERLRKGLVGISKISVQTGTSHGGVVLPDGSIAQVALDFDTLKTLSAISRGEFGLAGAVQHGASTLPQSAFHKFVECETAEVHLATEFQNMIYESRHFPQELKNKIYEWLKVNAAGERKENETDEQFFYRTRKKALGPFKRDIMGLSDSVRDSIAAELEEKFEFLFKQLNVINKKELVDKHILLKRVISRKRKEASKVVHTGEGAD